MSIEPSIEPRDAERQPSWVAYGRYAYDVQCKIKLDVNFSFTQTCFAAKLFNILISE